MASRGWTKFENQFDLPLDDKKEKETLPLSSKHKGRDRDESMNSNLNKRDHNNSGAGLTLNSNQKEMTIINASNNNNNINNNNANRISKTNYNALEELRRGTPLLKYPQHFEGSPHFKYFQLSGDNLRLQWYTMAKPLNNSCVYIKDIKDIIHGQETEPFKKHSVNRQIEKACFSIIYSNNIDGMTSLDLGAKSLDEASMWVRVLTRLKKILEENGSNEENLTKLDYLDVGIQFNDRNRPLSKLPNGINIFVRGNSPSQIRNVDPVLLKQISKEFENDVKKFRKLYKLSSRLHGTSLDEHGYIQQVLSDLEERLGELSNEIATTRDTELTKRDIWRFEVDLTCLEEKVLTLLNVAGLLTWTDKFKFWA